MGESQGNQAQQSGESSRLIMSQPRAKSSRTQAPSHSHITHRLKETYRSILRMTEAEWHSRSDETHQTKEAPKSVANLIVRPPLFQCPSPATSCQPALARSLRHTDQCPTPPSPIMTAHPAAARMKLSAHSAAAAPQHTSVSRAPPSSSSSTPSEFASSADSDSRRCDRRAFQKNSLDSLGAERLPLTPREELGRVQNYQRNVIPSTSTVLVSRLVRRTPSPSPTVAESTDGESPGNRGHSVPISLRTHLDQPKAAVSRFDEMSERQDQDRTKQQRGRWVARLRQQQVGVHVSEETSGEKATSAQTTINHVQLENGELQEQVRLLSEQLQLETQRHEKAETEISSLLNQVLEELTQETKERCKEIRRVGQLKALCTEMLLHIMELEQKANRAMQKREEVKSVFDLTSTSIPALLSSGQPSSLSSADQVVAEMCQTTSDVLEAIAPVQPDAGDIENSMLDVEGGRQPHAESKGCDAIEEGNTETVSAMTSQNAGPESVREEVDQQVTKKIRVPALWISGRTPRLQTTDTGPCYWTRNSP